MSQSTVKFEKRGERLQTFYKRKGYRSKRAFVAIMRTHGVPLYEQHVNRYFSGELDPLNLSNGLVAEGCDVNWLATGVFKGDQEGFVSEMDRRLLARLKAAGIDNVEKLNYFLDVEALASNILETIRDRMTKFSRTSKHK